jgi:threonylcarbamoyladenosine tRNA methylthiotransferase MtaB
LTDFDSISIGTGLYGVKVWICVLGCRANIYDGEAIAGDLAARGAVISQDLKGCRAAVIVSCSVTAVADKKCRQAVRRARRELGENGIVAVCGCWAQGLGAEEAKNLGVDILAGNRRKSDLAEAVESAVTSPSRREMIDMRRLKDGDVTWDPLALNRPMLRTRAFLKVQEGCDRYCTYCVIPFLRGRPVSRPLDDTEAEARRVVEAGCGEIVLTGIHLGMYGRDIGSSLAELVRRLSGIPGLVRLRLGSLEPFALDPDDGLLEALASSPVFCPHLHLPLQSGDDDVLARMRRGYTADAFVRVCDRAREKLGGDLHISSDILVAFPGESEKAFRATLALMERAELGRIHVFPYSPRRGTLAAEFPDRIPPRRASERVTMTRAAGERLLTRYASRFVGRDLSVWVESVSVESVSRESVSLENVSMESEGEAVLTGYTRHFVSAGIRFGSAKPSLGREAEARITHCVKGELRGYQNERQP